MVRFSTEICSSDAPPASKKLKCLSTTPTNRECAPNHQTSSGHSSRDSDSAPALFDLDALDCSVCMEPLSPPIFQCCNGHYACLACTLKMNNKCPACSEPTGKIRNLGLEKIIESLRVRCKFSYYGCTDLLTYGAKKSHEHGCLFAPYDCPFVGCPFCCPLKDFSIHFKEFHNAQTLLFQYDTWFPVSASLEDQFLLLQAEDRFFLLCVSEESLGKILYVSSFFHHDVEDSYHYCLEVKKGKRQLTMASTVQSHNYCKTDWNSIDFLLIPRCFLEGAFQVEITISCQRGSAGEFADPLLISIGIE